MTGPSITNFGGNVHFSPRRRYEPTSEAEVLEILDRHVGGRVRAVGALHSWSDVAACDDVSLDMRHLDSIHLSENAEGRVEARVGAGCSIGRLLRTLGRRGSTLPAIGAVTKQTIAGAISTGTHGSGRSSMSHHIEEVRVAAYDAETGRATIFDWTDGPELRAIRCGLGCMGIILSVRIRCIPEFLVEETVVRRTTLEDVLEEEAGYPLQQFALVPWLWDFLSFRRRELGAASEGGQSRWALLYRAYNRVNIDVFLHLLVKGLISRLGNPALIRTFYRHVLPRVTLRNRTVVDRSRSMLTLGHELFRHEEMEILVPARQLRDAVRLVREVTAVFGGTMGEGRAGDPGALSRNPARVAPQVHRALFESDYGSYTHHYPIFFRRILPDDTLISMSAGADDSCYSISFFTYLAPAERSSFYRYADVLARIMAEECDGRPHWGKYFPLSEEETSRLYPDLEHFREICRRTDPTGVFRNGFTERVIGY